MNEAELLTRRLQLVERRAALDGTLDLAFRWTMASAALFVLLALLGAVWVMFDGGREAILREGWNFVSKDYWDPVTLVFQGMAPVVGTLVSSLIALLIAVPVSFGIALFLTEVAPTWLRNPIAIAIELLAGIPSIIYGMWGLFVLVPLLGEHVYPWVSENIGQWPLVGSWFNGPPIGIGLLTAGIVLAIMIIPFIASVMREVFKTVPGQLKESAYALGSTTWEVVWDIVLPYTRSAVIGGVFLGLGRALGETMAVTFVIGNANRLATLLDPGSSISATIANEFSESFVEEHRAALLGLGFILFVVTLIVLTLAKLMLRNLKKREGR
jgi:phosphate transport system permease protein